MFRISPLLPTLVLLTSPLAAIGADAALWAIEADCEDGDWAVVVALEGFGDVDASCADGVKTRREVDVGTVVVTGVAVAAVSSLGTECGLPMESEPKRKLGCASHAEDADGFELEEELEVEVELRSEDGDEEDDADGLEEDEV